MPSHRRLLGYNARALISVKALLWCEERVAGCSSPRGPPPPLPRDGGSGMPAQSLRLAYAYTAISALLVPQAERLSNEAAELGRSKVSDVKASKPTCCACCTFPGCCCKHRTEPSARKVTVALSSRCDIVLYVSRSVPGCISQASLPHAKLLRLR